MAGKSEYKIATRSLDIGNARAYNAGDRVHVDVIAEHFTGDDYEGAFAAEGTQAAEAATAPADSGTKAKA
jgi:hypothetical protein